MSRFSPQVRPYVAAPLDFAPLTDSLREIRERRHRDRLEQEDRTRYLDQQSRLDDATALEATRYAQRQEQDAAARAADLLSKGFERASTYRDPARESVQATGASVNGIPILQQHPELRRGPGMDAQRLTVDDADWVYDPLRNLQRRRAEITTERAATKQGELQGRYDAAIENGVAPSMAQRYVFGPAGMTVEERQRLEGTQQSNRLELKAYEYGERAKLQKAREGAAFRLLSARQAGDKKSARQAQLEYQRAKDALSMADAQRRWAESVIPNDPMRYQDAMDDPTFAARIREAEEWLQQYGPGGGRQKLVDEVTNAGRDPNAPAADARTAIPRARYEQLVKQFGQARVDKTYRPQ